MKKIEPIYSSIQIHTTIANHIRLHCSENNLVISGTTETMWLNFISASMREDEEETA